MNKFFLSKPNFFHKAWRLKNFLLHRKSFYKKKFYWNLKATFQKWQVGRSKFFSLFKNSLFLHLAHFGIGLYNCKIIDNERKKVKKKYCYWNLEAWSLLCTKHNDMAQVKYRQRDYLPLDEQMSRFASDFRCCIKKLYLHKHRIYVKLDWYYPSSFQFIFRLSVKIFSILFWLRWRFVSLESEGGITKIKKKKGT